MSKPKNEPAFPVESCADHEFTGMSLRDYFAASALSGLTANPKFNPIKQMAQCAKDAYALADAMIAARSA